MNAVGLDNWFWRVVSVAIGFTFNRGGSRNFFRVGLNWIGLELGFVIGIQTGLGLGLGLGLFRKVHYLIKKKKKLYTNVGTGV